MPIFIMLTSHRMPIGEVRQQEALQIVTVQDAVGAAIREIAFIASVVQLCILGTIIRKNFPCESRNCFRETFCAPARLVAGFGRLKFQGAQYGQV